MYNDDTKIITYLLKSIVQSAGINFNKRKV